jgi:hypothetical protein
MPSGGNREGAGRKPNPKPPAIYLPPLLEGEILPARMDAVDFLLDIVNNSDVPVDIRVKAAIAAAPYQRAKIASDGVVGKKQKLKDAADEPAEDESVWGHLG